MRHPLVPLIALVALGAACDCGQRISKLTPELVITAPKEKDGDEWVLALGDVDAWATATGTIVLENRGTGDATITSLKLRDGSDPAFTLSQDAAPRGVAPAGVVTIGVTYAPKQKGPGTAWVDLTSDDPKLPKATVRLTGTGRAAAAEVCVEGADAGWVCSSVEGKQLAIDFGSMLIGAPPVSRSVRVRNVGTAPLQYYGTALIDPTSPEFTLDPSQDVTLGGVPMAVAGETLFSATFTPLGEGAVTGTAEVTTSDPAMPVVDITLKAQAAAALVCHLVVTPARIDFGNLVAGTTKEQALTITNAGTQPCIVSSLTLTGGSAFALVNAPSLPLTLAPTAAAPMKVRYSPAGTQTDTGSVTVGSDDPAHPSIVVPLTGGGVTQPDCVLTATPTSLNFGGVVPGDRSIMSVKLTATGSEPCNVTGVRLRNGNPNFKPALATPLMIFPAGGLGGFGSGNVGVTYAPTVAGIDVDTLVITYSVGLFGGQALSLDVPLSGKAGARRLCVTPNHLSFGVVPGGQTKTLPFTMTACGNAAVNVTGITLEQGGPPFSFSPAPTLPIALPRSQSATQPVLASPQSTAAASAMVHVVSDDPVFPDAYVMLTIGQELAAPDAGEIIYSWTAGAFSAGGSMDGTIYRTALQGPPNRTAFYGTQAGQQCAGCHAASPDGRYVALVEYGSSATMRIVDAKTGGSIPIANTSNGQFPSWRPNVATTPPYQFVYNDGNVLKIASLTAGVIGELAGANDPNKVQTQPSWGPNGTIAFVKGNPDADAGTFAIAGPADLMVIPESGGTATAVPGASANGSGNYYPEYSPNGKYLAYTFSAAGQTTRAAPDSVIRLVEVATGQIKTLPQLNAAGPNSWPTWSKDGQLLSFSSTRSGGKGSSDIYVAPVNQNTGVDGPASPLSVVNTANYDHTARWSWLPP